MKMDKIMNSWLGIVLAVIAVLTAGRVVRLVSWSFAKTCGYAALIGILTFALSRYAKKD